MERPLALVVDRDPTARDLIQNAFESQDLVVRSAANAADATSALASLPVRIVVVDVATPGLDVRELLQQAGRLARPPVVVAVARTVDPARDAALVASGALDVLGGPLDGERARLVALRAVRQAALVGEIRELREQLQTREGYHGVIGRTRAAERLRERLARLAEADGPVWLWGEPGTGKELAARALHARSRRAEGPFGVLSCASIVAADGEAPPDPFKGLAAAHAGGMLYLEDVPALSLELQSRLERAVEGLRAGAGVGVRVLASSTEAPEALVGRGRLLETLADRLGRETIELPPLRARADDIPLLARHFIATICWINLLPPIQLSPEALALLESHPWPDNIQGLRNVLEQAVILSPDGTIRPRDLPDRLRESAEGARGRSVTAGYASTLWRFREAKREVVEAFERSYLGGLMDRHGGNVTAAAQQAGMLRSALQRLLRKYGLKSAQFRRERRPPPGEELSRPRR